MASKTSPSPPSAVHPPLGTLIDGDSLELVEVLGVGGYGVVYRAADVRYPSKSYAVKCLVAAGHQTARQRQIHIREITLHQLASIHPGVVTLHRVVEHFNHTYIIMDYAPDHDLFTQILHNCRYLGNDALIKDVFLQMLDAVEYCHSLGIYHRDLKPENILCFDDGLRVAITDFGLATTDKISDEFRTGSVYHMSPECQGGAFAPGGKYSPMFNDIWSLGIILLNLATGRNPWKSATADDPTFQAYLRDPYGFLPTVLPISAELNDILVQMLEVDWRQRMKVNDIRYAIEELTSFYSDGVVFEGSMARCPWEAGMDIDSESSEENVEEATPSPPVSVSPTSPVKEASRLTSSWSKDSTSDIIFAGRPAIQNENYGAPWPAEYSSCAATWAFDSPASSSSSNDVPFSLDRCQTPSEASTESPTPSLPATPNQFDMSFGHQQPKVTGLTINTKLNSPRIFVNGPNESMGHTFSTDSDMMHTAIEYDPYSSLFFLSTPISAKLAPDSAVTAVAEDKEMISPSVWRRSYIQMASPDEYSPREDQGAQNYFARSASPSPEEPRWSSLMASPQHPFAQVQSQPHHPSQPTSPCAFSPMTDSSSPRQQGQRQSRVFSPRKPLRKSLVPASPIPPSPTFAHVGHSPFTARTPVTTSSRVPAKQQPQSRAQANAQEQQQGRFFPRPTPSPQQAAAPPAASAQVGTSARGRVVNTKPYSTFGRRKAVAQQAGQGDQGQDVVESRSSGGGRSSKTSSRCSSRSGRESVCSSGGSSAVFEKVERRRVVGRRNAARHWFNPGKFFAAVGAA